MQKLLQTSDNMNSNVFFSLFLSVCFTAEEKKKRERQILIPGYCWLVASTFIAGGDSWLLILRNMKPCSSMDQFKLVCGGFTILLPDPSPPPSFQYFEPHFLYSS